MSSRKRIEIEDAIGLPNGRRGINRFIKEIQEMQVASRVDRAALDRQLQEAYPGGFDYRDEANALVAMSVRNGPLEELHAGMYSTLLEEEALSRLTDDEMKVLMVYATRMLAALLALRDNAPEAYRRHVQSYGRIYCDRWERSGR
jgi:Fe-S cluster assembly ATPase SufC